MAVARRGAVSPDCADARPRAESWAAMPGGEIVFTSAATAVVRTDWVALSAIEVPAYQPPTWPEPDVPKQIHLDLAVSDLETAAAGSQRLSATLAAQQPAPERRRVLFRPRGSSVLPDDPDPGRGSAASLTSRHRLVAPAIRSQPQRSDPPEPGEHRSLGLPTSAGACSAPAHPVTAVKPGKLAAAASRAMAGTGVAGVYVLGEADGARPLADLYGPPLAQVPVGSSIPEEAYQLVAELLAFLCRTDTAMAAKISGDGR